MRVRLYQADDAGALKYRTTLHVEPEDLDDAGDELVARNEVTVGDVAYMGDFFLRLDSTNPVRWTQLDARRPELKGLYGQAVAAEEAVAAYH